MHTLKGIEQWEVERAGGAGHVSISRTVDGTSRAAFRKARSAAAPTQIRTVDDGVSVGSEFQNECILNSPEGRLKSSERREVGRGSTSRDVRRSARIHGNRRTS